MENVAHIVYGEVPQAIVAVGADAQACSPHMPGAPALEHLTAASAQSAVIYAPAGTTERRYVLALALRALKPATTLLALAPKAKGGSRLRQDLERFGCTVAEEARAHHRICHALRPENLRGIEEALHAGGMHKHAAHGLFTQAGIFSFDRIDVGTQLLLNHLPPLQGKGADFGCGIGVLTRAALALPQVAAITLIDRDRRAVEASRRNVIDGRAQFLWADVTSDHFDLRDLDFIIMNPPFHDGALEDKTLGQRFIMSAARALKKGGICALVANNHLPYEQVLAQHFMQHSCTAQAYGFKILVAVK